MHALNELINKIKKRRLSLIFDDNQSDFQEIESEISQGSFISLILFLVYIRFLASKIRAIYNCNIASFINDVAIYVENKTVA